MKGHNMNEAHPRKTLLVSNDDGYESHFLRALVDQLIIEFDVFVVAPRDEQSWVGRAMTRSGVLEAARLDDWPCPAWSVSGRPADCVNVGLNHLLPRRPDAVVSGMNLGFNVTLPLTLGSGTVAAATEGALAGLPAIAFSLSIPRHEFMEVSKARGRRDQEGERLTQTAAKHARTITSDLLGLSHIPYAVHNINFPPQITAEAKLTSSAMTISQMPSLFSRVEGSADSDQTQRFSFEFASEWKHTFKPADSDLEVLKRGEISHTVLRWDHLSQSR